VIALSLEGLVEWRHHKELVHEAQASLQVEIEANARELQKALKDVDAEQKQLAEDVVILQKIIDNPKANLETPKIDIHIPAFDDVSWQTAKATGALSYMPYGEAHRYSDIYKQQDEVDVAEHQAVNDVVLSVALKPFLEPATTKFNPEDAPLLKQRIKVLQVRLYLLAVLIHDLDGKYQKFLAAHPE
jgi:O6-methylguanine-DNA--protein-cysteine methyltransferase